MKNYLGASSGCPLNNGCINIERISSEVHQILSLELQPVCSVGGKLHFCHQSAGVSSIMPSLPSQLHCPLALSCTWSPVLVSALGLSLWSSMESGEQILIALLAFKHLPTLTLHNRISFCPRVNYFSYYGGQQACAESIQPGPGLAWPSVWPELLTACWLDPKREVSREQVFKEN